MKKIVLIVAIATIPIITIIGGLYLFGNIEKNNIIKEAIDEIESPYYNNLASQCGNKGEYKCCLASVYSMIDLQARLYDEDICKNLRMDTLKCVGSYRWCVPLTDVTDSDTNKSCNTNDDCVRASCCHATDVINKEFAPDCSDVMCTMSCDTVLDCGQGEPVCNNGICEIDTK